jgi:TIR domain
VPERSNSSTRDAGNGAAAATAKEAVAPSPGRVSLFISHASEDNDFAMWLGSRLSTAGYDVWADVLRLRGGDDWSRVLEDALRNKAAKMLWVATKPGCEKQGVRNEIHIATDVMKKLGDRNFIIPLKLEECEAPFEAVHIQWIDFRKGWGGGFAEVLETLKEVGNLHRSGGLNADIMARWLAAQVAKNGSLRQATDVLVSNWLPVRRTPPTVRYFEFLGASAEDHAEAAIKEYTLPAARFGAGFFGFGDRSDYVETPTGVAPRLTQEIPLDDFRAEGFAGLKIEAREARNIYSFLMREAFECWLVTRGLASYSYSDKTRGYWVGPGLAAGKERVTFDWNNGWTGSRNLTGEVTRGEKLGEKRKIGWHYGVSAYVRLGNDTHIQLTPRVLFTERGEIIGSPKRMHALRRSIPRSWRNDRWRDLLLAFLYWASEGKAFIDLPVGKDRIIQVGAMPVTMHAPVTVASANDGVADDGALEDGDPVFDAEQDDGDHLDGDEDDRDA